MNLNDMDLVDVLEEGAKGYSQACEVIHVNLWL